MDLKEIRTRYGVSQKTIADILGCSVTVYSRYETGTRQPPLETLIALADYYKISMDELVGRIPMTVEVKKETPPPLGEDEMQISFSLDDAPQDENGLEELIRREVVRVVSDELTKRGL